MKFRFAQCELDTERHEFKSGGEIVHVEPQVFDLLAYLACNPGRLISKDELVEAIWDGRAVSDSAITSRINGARRAVGDDGFRQEVIAVVAPAHDGRDGPAARLIQMSCESPLVTGFCRISYFRSVSERLP